MIDPVVSTSPHKQTPRLQQSISFLLNHLGFVQLLVLAFISLWDRILLEKLNFLSGEVSLGKQFLLQIRNLLTSCKPNLGAIVRSTCKDLGNDGDGFERAQREVYLCLDYLLSFFFSGLLWHWHAHHVTLLVQRLHLTRRLFSPSRDF